ncbi:hypothetical protein J6590_039255 [Homalodisca vitripennis]|nr:hypothetical protein J6590_039255 [Homalodisca vitripennis]
MSGENDIDNDNASQANVQPPSTQGYPRLPEDLEPTVTNVPRQPIVDGILRISPQGMLYLIRPPRSRRSAVPLQYRTSRPSEVRGVLSRVLGLVSLNPALVCKQEQNLSST